MFSQEPHCHYSRNQLGEVICQLRFPEILAVGASSPVEFQEEIRAQYPQYQARREQSAPRLTGTPGHFSMEKPEPTMNYSFGTADGLWRINLTGTFISLSCQRYPSWEEFAARLDRPLAEFIRIYKPAYFERIGLRYMNFISRKDLDLEGESFRTLLKEPYLGILADEEVRETGFSQATVDAEFAIRSGCRAKIHSGTGLVRRGASMDPELKLIFDQDVYLPGQIPVHLAAASMQMLHDQAFCIFRDAITDRLHEAMEPSQS